jgi:hypothetical protein
MMRLDVCSQIAKNQTINPEFSIRDHQVGIAADPVLGLRWLKSYERHG